MNEGLKLYRKIKKKNKLGEGVSQGGCERRIEVFVTI